MIPPRKTIWAATATGLHNLFRLSSDAYDEGWLTKWPRMDKATISQCLEGLIASTGCPSGEAVQATSDYTDIFGEARYFLELMDHGIEIERRVRDGLLEIGKTLHPAAGDERLPLHLRERGRRPR